MITKEEAINGTLAWCNKKRAKKRLEPLTDLPKGIKGNKQSCPCGAATGMSVGTISCQKVNEYSYPFGDPEDLPQEVIAFVRMFDDGQIPEYDADL